MSIYNETVFGIHKNILVPIVFQYIFDFLTNRWLTSIPGENKQTVIQEID
jgi:hypothetical protein